mgnify:CR=1 FL=1
MLQKISQYYLDSGLKIIIKEDKLSPVTSFFVWVDTGSAYENDQERGLAHVHEHMIFKGTSTLKVGEISKQIEAHGGEINAFTSHDETVYYVTISNNFTSNYLVGSYEYDRPQYRLNVDIQKRFLDGRLILNLSSEDVFNTMKTPLKSRYLNQNNTFFAMPEFQKIRVGLRYNFGNFKLSDNNRETSIDEESRLQELGAN